MSLSSSQTQTQTSSDPTQIIIIIIIIGSFIHSISKDKIEFIKDNGLMIIGPNKKIICFQSASTPWTQSLLKEKLKSSFNDLPPHSSLRFIKLKRGEFILPGFIDTHTHAVQYSNHGLGQQYQLLDWLQNITFPEENKFHDLLYAQRILHKVVQRLLAVGTTTSCYYTSIHLGAAKILANLCHQLGQRAFIGRCNMDKNQTFNQYKEDSPQKSIQDSKDLINYIRSHFNNNNNHLHQTQNLTHSKIIHPNLKLTSSYHSYNSINSSTSSLVKPILTPRFALSCSEELMSLLGQMIKQDPQLYLQTHLSESISEIELTKSSFPNDLTYTAIYDRFGLLTPRTILAHCVHLDQSEINLLIQRQCGLSHCPTSNFNIRSGICQVLKLLNSGIHKIGLGTDISAGYGIGILSAIRNASAAAKALNFGSKNSLDSQTSHLSIQNLLYLATLGGAKVCGLDDRIGNFQVGKEFDALLIQTGAYSGELIQSDSSMLQSKIQSNQSNPSDKISAEYEFLDINSQVYHQGTNPNFFIDEQNTQVDLDELLEKFLFTGDDRNIGTVFVNSRVVGGARPLKLF
ncbi:hypothetical protein O181_086826 [Austropuccinia psidii MF-1]|uniref:Amidohydrolase-related domain-containing protein n=1 Tax=Austropuccinia psidii MF-1 TaxID=1389203 RepID=A0A9Q3INJ0_9BASI|nr:hypothetical protein [Austropuccinia psidii MF-1]